jgi:phage/plasmid primase-like uncharacterized protein
MVERARETDILAVAARHTEMSRAGHHEHHGPCPVCGGHDRFSVNIRKGVWYCRGCAKGGDVISLVRHITGGTFTNAVETLAGENWPKPRLVEARKAPASVSEHRLLALRLWGETKPIVGSVAETYLRTRCVDLDQIPDLEGVLRFHPNCPSNGARHPCLIALLRHAVTDEPTGIMRTALTADGRKIGRMALGQKAGSAIKVWPDVEVTSGLVVGEGLETIAAAATRIKHEGTRLQPAWALVDAGNLATFPPLPAIEHLTILVDKDQADKRGREAGQAAADACARSWLKAGRQVTQLIPHIVGTDFADIAQDEARP